jgi:hypothetical protein
MGFAYCDFHHQGGNQMLMARAAARPRSLRAPEQTGSINVSSTEVAARVETPRVESSRIEPVKPEVKSEPKFDSKNDGPLELRRSTE